MLFLADMKPGSLFSVLKFWFAHHRPLNNFLLRIAKCVVVNIIYAIFNEIF